MGWAVFRKHPNHCGMDSDLVGQGGPNIITAFSTHRLVGRSSSPVPVNVRSPGCWLLFGSATGTIMQSASLRFGRRPDGSVRTDGEPAGSRQASGVAMDRRQEVIDA